MCSDRGAWLQSCAACPRCPPEGPIGPWRPCPAGRPGRLERARRQKHGLPRGPGRTLFRRRLRQRQHQPHRRQAPLRQALHHLRTNPGQRHGHPVHLLRTLAPLARARPGRRASRPGRDLPHLLRLSARSEPGRERRKSRSEPLQGAIRRHKPCSLPGTCSKLGHEERKRRNQAERQGANRRRALCPGKDSQRRRPPQSPFCTPPQTDGKQAPTPPPPANRSQNRRGNRPENRLPARKTAGFHIKKRSKFKSLKTALAQYPLGPNAIVQGAKYKKNASACQAGRPAPPLRPVMLPSTPRGTWRPAGSP